MHITQESDYAVRIVYCLAQSGQRMDARSISDQMSVSLRFALKILGKLARQGIVASFKGNRGGYELARPAARISMLDVITAVEGPYQLSRCLDGNRESCNRDASGSCSFQRIFARISSQVNRELAAVDFQMLLNDEKCPCSGQKSQKME